MMDTVPDKIKLFNRTMSEELEKTKALYKQIEKGEIELADAMESWAARIDFMKFLIRRSNLYISMTQLYARKRSQEQNKKQPMVR